MSKDVRPMAGDGGVPALPGSKLNFLTRSRIWLFSQATEHDSPRPPSAPKPGSSQPVSKHFSFREISVHKKFSNQLHLPPLLPAPHRLGFMGSFLTPRSGGTPKAG